MTMVVNSLEMSKAISLYTILFPTHFLTYICYSLLDAKNHTMPIGEAFLYAFLQVLFDRLASNEFIGLFCGQKYGDMLEHLKITLLTVTALLNDAEEKQFDSLAVEKWLPWLKMPSLIQRTCWMRWSLKL